MADGVLKFLQSPLFISGFIVKLIFVALFSPDVQQQWFIPFVVSAIENPSFFPWDTFINSGGSIRSFPYGPVMLLLHVPTVLCGWLIDQMFNIDVFAPIGFRLGLLLADVMCLLVLLRLLKCDPRHLVIFYWLSPIVFYITYWHGQTDIVPVLLLLVSLLYLQDYRVRWAGFILAMAVSAKMSMLLAFPIVACYLWVNTRLRFGFYTFLFSFVFFFIVAQSWLMWSPGYVDMVLQSPEIGRLYQLTLDYGDGINIYLAPMAYLFLLYWIWRMKRINFDLLLSVLGVTFFIIILMTPASVGWYLWVVPFLVVHQVRHKASAVVIVAIFSLLLVAYCLFISSGGKWLFMAGPLLIHDYVINGHIRSLWETAITAMGIILVVQMIREGVSSNDYYHIGKNPLLFGVAGDSSSGRTQVCSSISALFGEHSVSHLACKDYLLWDRRSPMWTALTPLNPRANNLFRLTQDVMSLASGKSVLSRRFDIKSGGFTDKMIVDKKDVIIVSGLHALFSESLVNKLSLKIFIDSDDCMSEYWNARLSRPVDRSGDDLRWKSDKRQYLLPQMEHADIVFIMLSSNPVKIDPEIPPGEVNFTLKVVLRDGLYYENLARVLIGVCGLRLDMEFVENSSSVEMLIEGDVWREDIAHAAEILVPHLDELLDVHPEWQGGLVGVMQVIILSQLSQEIGRT